MDIMQEEYDYVILDGKRNVDTTSMNMNTSQSNSQSNSQKEDPVQHTMDTEIRDSTTTTTIDNLIIPDLHTMLSNIQLAPASEIAYFYLQNTIGLEPQTMWKITEAGSILGFTVQNLERKINLLKRVMNLNNNDIKEIVSKQPSILHMSANRNISPTVLFLVRKLDLSKMELRSMVLAFPCILCYSMQNLGRKLQFFEMDLGLDMDGVRELLVEEPKLLCAAVDSLLPRFKFLHKEMGIPLHDLQKIIKANPRLLLYSLKNNLQAKLISFFIMRLHMQPEHILRLLSSYPLIMDYSLEHHMLPIARYFVLELEFSPMEMRRILLKFPRLMTHSLFKIKHVVGYLRYQLGMDATEVKRVLFQAPQVVSLSTDDTLVSKVSFLRDAFGLKDEDGQDLRKVIAGMPTLLLCSVEKNLEPKVEYLLEQFGGDEMKMRQAILTQPTLLGYSLVKRIRPRMDRILDIGADPIKITVGITMTNDNFEKWLANKSSRIQNGGQLIKIKKKKKKKKVGQDAETAAGTSNSIDLDAQQRSGRIVHWKRL